MNKAGIRAQTKTKKENGQKKRKSKVYGKGAHRLLGKGGGPISPPNSPNVPAPLFLLPKIDPPEGGPPETVLLLELRERKLHAEGL